MSEMFAPRRGIGSSSQRDTRIFSEDLVVVEVCLYRPEHPAGEFAYTVGVQARESALSFAKTRRETETYALQAALEILQAVGLEIEDLTAVIQDELDALKAEGESEAAQ